MMSPREVLHTKTFVHAYLLYNGPHGGKSQKHQRKATEEAVKLEAKQKIASMDNVQLQIFRRQVAKYAYTWIHMRTDHKTHGMEKYDPAPLCYPMCNFTFTPIWVEEFIWNKIQQAFELAYEYFKEQNPTLRTTSPPWWDQNYLFQPYSPSIGTEYTPVTEATSSPSPSEISQGGTPGHTPVPSPSSSPWVSLRVYERTRQSRTAAIAPRTRRSRSADMPPSMDTLHEEDPNPLK